MIFGIKYKSNNPLFNNSINIFVMLHIRLLRVLGGIFHILRLIFLKATLYCLTSFSLKFNNSQL